MKKILYILAAQIIWCNCYAQVSTLGNTSINPNDYLGWNSNTPFDLKIAHYGNYSVKFWTVPGFGINLTESGPIKFATSGLGFIDTKVEVGTNYIGFNLRSRNIVTQAQNLSYGGSFRMRSNAVLQNSAVVSTVDVDVTNDYFTEYNYGIYARTCNNISKGWAVNAWSPIGGFNYAGWFAGNIYASSVWGWSDIALKTGVVSLENCTELLENIEPKSYHYRVDEFPSLNLPSGIHYGMIAQEVESIIPEVVKTVQSPALLSKPSLITEDDGTCTLENEDWQPEILVEPLNLKAVEYRQLIAVLVGAIQEGEEIIVSQQETIENLENAINQIETALSE